MVDVLIAESEIPLERRKALDTPQKIRILRKVLDLMFRSSSEALNVYEHFLSQVLTDTKFPRKK